MDRREFLWSSVAGAVATSGLRAVWANPSGKPRRVGLIGCGWYGKSDSLRLIQVAPVDVVSLCDVDRRMLDDAVELVASRQASRAKPRAYADYRRMLEEKDLEKHVAPAIRGHMLDWLAAVDARGRPVADIEQGHISTTSCILANIAMKVGRTLAWDPSEQRVRDDEQANTLLRRAYRGPWVHPEP
ncbi:MAG: hypothetical protein FJ297_06725 [Planctomycetes bacterium]|nr:hypothetical protein [Planctomycetota bacterium]